MRSTRAWRRRAIRSQRTMRDEAPPVGTAGGLFWEIRLPSSDQDQDLLFCKPGRLHSLTFDILPDTG